MVGISVHNRERLTHTPAHDVALECLAAGIDAAVPARVVGETVSVSDSASSPSSDSASPSPSPSPNNKTLQIAAVDGSNASYALCEYDRVRLVGAGKAADGLAAALVEQLGDRVTDGAVVTTDAADASIDGPVDVLEGGHPRPTARGVEHTNRIVETVTDAGADDLVVVALTGGGSALCAAPAPPLTVSDLRTLTDDLLACGASIAEINAVRKHCSAVKGGRLARLAAPATVVTLAMSDVIGDDLAVIASGPTVPDPSTYDDALATVDRYSLTLPPAVETHLRAGAAGERPETPTAADPTFERASAFVLANGETALDAAGTAAAKRGYHTAVVATDVDGEARLAGREHAALATRCVTDNEPHAPPVVLLSGGETTVTLETASSAPGAGGPNGEFAMAAAAALDVDDVVIASVDTDGIDGATTAAGGIVDATTVSTSDALDALARHDVAPRLADADARIETGPTGTNVNDLRVVVIGSPPE